MPGAGLRDAGSCSPWRNSQWQFPPSRLPRTAADGRVGVPRWLTALLAWKCPPVPGNSIQMFSPTGWRSSAGAKEPGLGSRARFTPSQGNQSPTLTPTNTDSTAPLPASCSFGYILAASGRALSDLLHSQQGSYVKFLLLKQQLRVTGHGSLEPQVLPSSCGIRIYTVMSCFHVCLNICIAAAQADTLILCSLRSKAPVRADRLSCFLHRSHGSQDRTY